MSRLIGIPKKLRDAFVRRQPGKPVTLAAERFIEVFREHGVEAAQIPRLLPEVKLDDLQSSDRLLGILTPDLIDKVAKLFGVRSQWLDGCDERIYDYLATYKEPQRLLNHFRTLWNMPYWEETVGTPLRLLTTKQHLNYRDDQREELAPILVEPIAEIGDETIYRYHIYQDGFSWDHPPARIELKAIGRTIYRALRNPIPLYQISPQDMEALLDGQRIPRCFLQGCLLTEPCFEDYVLNSSESAIARETDELPKVIDYMTSVGLDTYNFQIVLDTTEAIPEPASTPTPAPAASPSKDAKSGKRQTNREIWRAIETAASTIWTIEPLSIEDMARRLQMLPHVKAVGFKTDTIRKHIRHLAPEGIRGKPGRKPGKSN